MEKELENIFKQIATDLHNKPGKDELIALTGCKGGWRKEELIATFSEDGDKKVVQFQGKYRENPRSFPKLKPLIDYLDKNNYQWK